MGTLLIYFKNYEIDKMEEEIIYLDGDDWGITYRTAGLLSVILRHNGVSLPHYDMCNPPKSGKLEDLVEPEKVAEAARKSVELLEKEENPIIIDFEEEENLFEEYLLKDRTAKELNDNIKYYLKEMQRLSEEGYYFVGDID